ncbi:aspartate aminotransferase family protein [Gracilinema caldarium]|uniref:Acetylornithine aminotransferase n=1 Tax=Gracilinema caldarium (strain ATCC 51460 / DSM 7334 / H1) TaxID=744872 RepID=F8F1I7_GRAC1|nr:acetylornithine/succinylornithine family transaminase [Gracilinema caldarium]AEJ19040.1 Acetylornithine/succinyldiaminopimelateaminotransferase [Gracilinema caldarium DSM 7334]
MNSFMNTYHRLPVVFTKGSGARLTDSQGKTYVDFTSGIAVNCLGHNHPALVKAINDQAARLIHTSNYFLSDTSIAFAERLVQACKSVGMERVFLCNSGAEANEGAIKIARKYSQSRYGNGRHRIVTLKGSFHGRTLTTLSATGQDRFHPDSFAPYTEGFIFVEPHDIPAMEKALDGTVAAVLMEPIQGESGIRPLDAAYVQRVAQLCRERDVLLMFDEVQSGVGRTGTFLASEIYQVQVDVVTLAKGLSGGVPVGAVLAGQKTAETLGVGDHGSTFGGNPLAAAAGLAVLSVVDQPALLAEISRKGNHIMETIRAWKHPAVREVRGRGLMIGIDIAGDAWPVLEAALQQGLLLLSAGQKTLRLLPPYIITDDEIDEGLKILRSILDTISLGA